MRNLLIISSAALSLAGAGIAVAQEAPATPQTYPLCSKTVHDECMNPSEARGSVKAHKAVHHHHKAHRG